MQEVQKVEQEPSGPARPEGKPQARHYQGGKTRDGKWNGRYVIVERDRVLRPQRRDGVWCQRELGIGS